jgi:phosphate butyryltransferase
LTDIHTYLPKHGTTIKKEAEMTFKSISSFIEMAKAGEKRKIAVAAAEDEPVLMAVKNAIAEGIVEPILVGDEKQIREISAKIDFSLDGIEIINELKPANACRKAVALIKEKKAGILMKGLVGTADLLKAVLDKENGLRKGSVISHIAFFESPYYHKVFIVTDAAMNVAPEFKEKVAIVENAVDACHRLGLEKPKVAVIGAVEVINEKMEATVHAGMLTMMNKRGQIKGCIIDGPFALDNAVSKEACHHKKIETEVGGDADILMCPDIEAANVLYKCLNFLGGAESAAVIMGASVPIVLTSRADSEKSKLNSIALAAAMK